MIIMFDGYFHEEIVLIGRKYSKQQLKKMYIEARKQTFDEKELTDVFCRLYGFEKIPHETEIRVDFVLDTDTDIIYIPHY